MLKSAWLKSELPTLHRSIADSMQLPYFMVKFHEICSWSTASLASAWPSHSPERPQTSRPKWDQWNSGLISWNIQGHVVKHHNQWLEKCRRKPYGWFFCGTSWTIFSTVSWILRSQTLCFPGQCKELHGSYTAGQFQSIRTYHHNPPISSVIITSCNRSAIPGNPTDVSFGPGLMLQSSHTCANRGKSSTKLAKHPTKHGQNLHHLCKHG